MKEIKRTKQVGIALTDDEFAIIKKGADKNRMSLATYIRSKFFLDEDKYERQRKEVERNVD